MFYLGFSIFLNMTTALMFWAFTQARLYELIDFSQCDISHIFSISNARKYKKVISNCKGLWDIFLTRLQEFFISNVQLYVAQKG